MNNNEHIANVMEVAAYQEPHHGKMQVVNNKIHVNYNEYFNLRIRHTDVNVRMLIFVLMVGRTSDEIDHFVNEERLKVVKKCSIHQEVSPLEDEDKIIKIPETENVQYGNKRTALLVNNTFNDVQMKILCSRTCESIRKRRSYIRIYFCHSTNINEFENGAHPIDVEIMVHKCKGSRTKYWNQRGIMMQENREMQVVPITIHLRFERRELAIKCLEGILKVLTRKMRNGPEEERTMLQRHFNQNYQILRRLEHMH